MAKKRKLPDEIKPILFPFARQSGSAPNLETDGADGRTSLARLIRRKRGVRSRFGYDPRPWSSWTANSDKKYIHGVK